MPNTTSPTAAASSRFFETEGRTLMLEPVSLHRAVERHAASTIGDNVLMARAGVVTAQYLCEPISAARLPERVWLFAGPGNNGGDALCAAAELQKQGVTVRVCLPVEPKGKTANWALNAARSAGVSITSTSPSLEDCRDADWLVDGLFGIGLGRAITAPFAPLVALLNAHRATGGRVLALDVPSGLDADKGTIVGDPAQPDAPVAVEASHTITFLAGKPGLFTGKGRDLAGKIVIAPLGLDAASFDAAREKQTQTETETQQTPRTPPPRDDAVELNTPARFVPYFPRRRATSHKGTFGSIAIVGGDLGTCGAVILAARAALYCGAGKIHAALLGEGGPPYDPPHPEIMLRHVDKMDLDDMDAVAIGPGLGKSDHAVAVLQRVLALGVPTLIDADALNLISNQTALVQCVRDHGRHIVITPHPAEAARLLGVKTAEVEADRIAAVHALADKFQCTALLKGSGTLIANPQGRVAINATGNAGLSTGGTGDVLSGVIGAFLAQHVAPFEAALAGSWVHGRAAEMLSDAGTGPAGLTAGELAPEMRSLLNQLYREYRLIG